MVQISAVIITFNEESNITRCLQSLDGVADEIIVVDSFSKDKTKEICLSYGVKFFERAWKGYSDQKNWGNEQATSPYILSLDADEALSDGLKNKIIEIKNSWTHDGYKFNRLNLYCGKDIKHGGWYPDIKLRLFDRRKARWNSSAVHEHIEMADNASVKYVDADITHYACDSITKQLVFSYIDLWTEQAVKSNKKISLLKVYLSPKWRFFRDFILKRGFLEGLQGYNLYKTIAYETLLKYSNFYLFTRMAKKIKIEKKSNSGSTNNAEGSFQFCIHIQASSIHRLTVCLRGIDKHSKYNHTLIVNGITNEQERRALEKQLSYYRFAVTFDSKQAENCNAAYQISMPDSVFVMPSWDYLLLLKVAAKS